MQSFTEVLINPLVDIFVVVINFPHVGHTHINCLGPFKNFAVIFTVPNQPVHKNLAQSENFRYFVPCKLNFHNCLHDIIF